MVRNPDKVLHSLDNASIDQHQIRVHLDSGADNLDLFLVYTYLCL